jgi:hypothetical protein
MEKNNVAVRKRNVVLTVLFVLAIGTTAQLRAEQTPPKEPTYHNLRFKEDFSYLAGPEDSYIQDIWDPIKWITLSDEWHLTVGGQARLRFESETDKDFGVSSPSHDAFLLQRYFIHTDFRHVSGMRFFIQGKFAYSNDRDKGGEDTLENYADFHQAFMDIPLGSTIWRLGRQELQYGNQRLISPLDWGNLRRSFDGIKVAADLDDWRIEAFAVRPVVNDIKRLDSSDQDRDFYGLYTTHKGTEKLASDYYFLVLKDNRQTTNSNGRTGRQTVYTLGTRLYGKQGNWDYETEFGSQFGTYAGDRIRAWMATAGGGYTFSDVDMQPKISLFYDYASGDSDPTDGTHETFNQLFPLGHAYFGYLDRVGRRNIHAIKAQFKVKPSRKLTAWADFHTFFLDTNNDALYGANGKPLRPATGSGSDSVGHELDITVKYIINRHTTALAGWAHMWPGGFIEESGASEDADLFYAQVEYKF